MTQAFIGLGANLGEPLRQLQDACVSLNARAHTRIEVASAVYRSAAIGPGPQGDYLNAAVRVTTTLRPIELLDFLQAIEDAAGRTREVRWGPRLIDLDLLLYGTETIDHPRLSVPHPEIPNRNFVLVPLADVLPTSFPMPSMPALDELLAGCPDNPLERIGGSLLAAGQHRT